MLRIGPDKGQAHYSMVYQVSKVVHGITEVLGPTGHTMVLSDLDRLVFLLARVPVRVNNRSTGLYFYSHKRGEGRVCVCVRESPGANTRPLSAALP